MEALRPTAYAVTKYNITSPIDFDSAMSHGTVLMAISGADGELNEKEFQWYIEEQKMLFENFEEYVEALQTVDWKNADIAQLLASERYEFPLNFRKGLLYQAIRMSRADGTYHEKEKAAVKKAAEVLDVDEFSVANLESVADIEDVADRLRRSLLETTTAAYV